MMSSPSSSSQPLQGDALAAVAEALKVLLLSANLMASQGEQAQVGV